jgi:hypothetical protein
MVNHVLLYMLNQMLNDQMFNLLHGLWYVMGPFMWLINIFLRKSMNNGISMTHN